ncbi:MAG TPA: hypothetical protein PK759_03845 [Spirochaetales bacterium]|nr:hypothetical protein [Spirochaetales bacterium]HPS14916.1 hypothetical protein [Spirochaetales bacterium]
MSRYKLLDFSPKTIILMAALCAFCAVFSTFDTSEQYRAWKTARTWTEEQKVVAPAMDADAMTQNALVSLLLNTIIIAISLVCMLVSVMAIATDNARVLTTASVLVVVMLVFGLLYSVSTLLYQYRVGPRLTLKGPVFDYDLHMQVPVVIAVAAYPLLSIFWLVARRSS